MAGYFETALKGQGFSRAVSAAKWSWALARRDDFFKVTHYRFLER
jgi:hypothetical protein